MLAHLATTALLLLPPAPAQVVGLIAGQGAGDINHTASRYAVHATDLGVMWRDSRGRVAIAFGDTYGVGWGGHGAGPETADWRFNTLAHSTDRNLADGLSIDSMVTDRPGHAKQILPGDPSVQEVTVIPTAAVSVGSRDYLHYMSVRSWGSAGTWTTNYAGLAHSDDGGRNWTKSPTARWDNRGAFQLGAMVRRAGYVYLFGTPNGRLGDASVSRVPENEVLNLAAYQYWTGDGWRTGALDRAVPVMSGQVGELSVQYNSALGRWVALHLDENRAAIVLRTAPDPAGPWTGGQVVVDGKDHPGLYGAFLHPDSATNSVLHFAMSRWDPYHVELMSLRLADLRGDGNVLQEGGFEHRTGAWRVTGQGGVDEGLGLARSGANNGWVRNTSGWNDLFQQAVVRPGQRYRLTGWVRSSGSTGDGYFGVRRPGGGGVVAERKYGSLPAYSWLSVEFTATEPRVEIFAGRWARDGQDTWAQVDDVLLEPIS